MLAKIKDDQEELIKFKTKLFGNIKFVGELYNRGILAESIILSIFDMMIAHKNKTTQYLSRLTDDTVEGACILINKIGFRIDERIEAEVQKQNKKGEAPKNDKAQNNLSRLQEYDSLVFKRFEEIVSDPKFQQRT